MKDWDDDLRKGVMTGEDLDLLTINTIGTLSIDAIQQATSGYRSAVGVVKSAYVMADAPGGLPKLSLSRRVAKSTRSLKPMRPLQSGAFVSTWSQCHRGIFSSIGLTLAARVYYRPVSPPGSLWSKDRLQVASDTWDHPAKVIGMHTFGASAPLKKLRHKFGVELDRVVAAAKEIRTQLMLESVSLPHSRLRTGRVLIDGEDEIDES
jgi:hypothetical protein